uniref:Uncharacterized protein n=1 Tax=Lotharella globosa TaxID=91324 RepID=A0A6V3RLE1_9EUKA|mmetsp:Transcript_31575/g.61856  ORF Transcript_31575/g.61856 Transcript_31575/m.61856 type:complete len:318 (+) Transcript_31575:72-1025(+)
MVDAQRELLDQLMGKERNASLEEREKMQRHFWDDDVCKHFLVGITPHELFKNTKSDLGEYDKLFDMRAKHEWDALSQEDKDKYPYQWDTLDLLKKLIEECDRKIQRGKERCEADERLKNEPKKLNEDEAKRLGQIQEEIGKLGKEAEEAGENGDIEKAKALATKVEGLKAESEQIMKKPDDPRFNSRQLMVCEVSGVLMSTTDSESRLKSLYSGKQYQGWKKVRDFHAELSKLLEGKSRPRRPWPHEDRDRKGSRDRDRGRGERSRRDRSRSRDRRRDRDDRRRRDRSRDRDRRRDRSRDRDRRRRRRDDSRDRRRY